MSGNKPEIDFNAFYGPLSTEALSYVALTITTVATEAAIVAGAISSGKSNSVPLILLALVIVTTFLSFVFALAAIARMELLSHVATRAGVYGLPDKVTQPAPDEPLAPRFMRGWFRIEQEFFGYDTNGRSPGTVRKVSSVRVVGALTALAFYNVVILYVLSSHVAW